MKFLFSLFILCFLTVNAVAQCNLDPTIEGDLTLCQFDSTTTLTTQEFDIYQWYTFRGLDTFATAIDGATEQTLVLEGTGEVNTLYFVEVTEDTCTAFSDTVEVGQVFYTVPEVEFSNEIFFDNANFYLCEEDTALLNYNYGTTLFWLRNGDTVAFGDNPLSINEGGNYTVVAAPEYCTDMIRTVDISEIVDTSCVSSTMSGNTYSSIDIFPNPVRDHMNIRLPSTYASMSFQIIDASGKEVLFLPVRSDTFTIETTSLHPGVYTLIWSTGQELLATRKFVKK